MRERYGAVLSHVRIVDGFDEAHDKGYGALGGNGVQGSPRGFDDGRYELKEISAHVPSSSRAFF